MKNEETTGFEDEIVSEETNPKIQIKKPEQKPNAKPAKTFSFKKPNISFSSFKKPKLLTVISLFLAILAIYSIFVILQSKIQTPQSETVTKTQNQNQEGANKSQTSDLSSRIDLFYKKIDSASTTINPPQLDLNLNY